MPLSRMRMMAIRQRGFANRDLVQLGQGRAIAIDRSDDGIGFHRHDWRSRIARRFIRPERDYDVLPAFCRRCPHLSPQDSPRLATIEAISWPSGEFRSIRFSISIRAANSGPFFLFNSATFPASALAFLLSFS